MNRWHSQIQNCSLTFDHVLNVSGVLQDLRQAVQQHGGLAVAVGYILRLLEHLIQSC